jgi:hypothetical protein
MLKGVLRLKWEDLYILYESNTIPPLSVDFQLKTGMNGEYPVLKMIALKTSLT